MNTLEPPDDIRIPAIELPFPAGPRAAHPAAAMVCRQIAETPAAAADPRLRGLVEFAGRLYPECTPSGLLLASLLFALIGSHRDWVRPRSPDEVARAHLAILTAMDGRHTGPREPGFVRLAEWLGQCLADTADQETNRRFRAAFARCLDAHVWELDWRGRHRSPDMAVYPALRRAVSGIPVVYTLHPLLFGIPVDAALFDHPAVDQLQTLSADYCVWADDLLTLRREKSCANLVLALRADLRCGLDEAIDRSVALLRRQVASYLDLRVRLPHLGVASATLTMLLDRQESWSVDTIAVTVAEPAAP